MKSTRNILTFLVGLAVSATPLLLPSIASADSISFIRDGNVWIATPDGSRTVQLTTQGGYSYASQADDGTLIALNGIRLHRLSRTGAVLADFTTPVSDTSNDGNDFRGPFSPVISPDGTKVAYGYFFQSSYFDSTCNCIRTRLSSGTGYSHSDRLTSWEEPGLGRQSGWFHPSWIDNQRTLLSEPGAALNEDVIVDTVGDGNQEIQRWFTDNGVSGLRDGEMDRQRTKLAFVAHDQDSVLRVYRMTGEPSALPEACYAYTDPQGRFSSPSWSPDGNTLAWAEDDGIRTAPVPDLSAACQVGSLGTVVIPNASVPDWGPADVPVPQTGGGSGGGTGGPGGGSGGGPGGGSGSPQDSALTVRVSRTSLARALRRGLTARIGAPVAGRVRIEVRRGRTRVAAGSARVGAGRASVRARFSSRGRRALRSVRRARLTVRVSLTPATGSPQRATARVTLAR